MYINNQNNRFFYTPYLNAKIKKITEVLGDKTKWLVYPDATLKTNKLPTGFVYFANANDLLLMPYHLRDPGCGFLLFRVKNVKNLDETARKKICNEINAFILQLEKEEKKVNVLSVLHQGLYAIPEAEKYLPFFVNAKTPLDSSTLDLSFDEIEVLQQDFMCLTNTIELKEVIHCERSLLQSHQIDQGSILGFIHSGCHHFASLLNKKFFPLILSHFERTYAKGMEPEFSFVPLQTPLGHTYQQWVHAGMNYAVSSRFSLFQALQKRVWDRFHLSIEIISDSMHAGIFYQNDTVFCTRGVQFLHPQQLTLITNECEAISALVTRGENASYYENLIAHGSGCCICEDFDYENALSEHADKYITLLKQCAYNTTPNLAHCLPYTYNLLLSLDIFEQIGLSKTAAILAPLVNVQSQYLQPPLVIK